MVRRGGAWLSVGVLAAAGSGCAGLLGIEDPGAGADAGPEPSLLRVVWNDVYFDSDGSQLEPRTLGVTAYVPEGNSYRAVTGAPGMFSTSVSVPAGDVIVQTENREVYALTSARDLDLGVDIPGRMHEFASAGTTVQLDETLPLPWQDGFTATFVEPNTGLSLIGSPASFPAGTTQVAMSFDWHGFPRFDFSLGDTPMLVVMGPAPPGGFDHQLVLATWRASDPLEIMNGQANVASGSFAAGPGPSRTLSVDWRRSAFAAIAGDISPNADFLAMELIAYALPPGPCGFFTGFWPRHMLLFRSATENTDVDTGQLTLANPYPPGWTVARWSGVSAHVPFDKAPAYLSGVIASLVDIDAASRVAAPIISPPRFPTINGRGAFAETTDAGLEPLLAWSAPATGPVDRYLIRVERIGPIGERDVALLVVPGRVTSVRLPPGAMDPLRWHVIIIRAVATSGDAEREPMRCTLPLGIADVVSGPIAVDGAPF